METVKPYPGYPDEVTWKQPLYTTARRPKPDDAHYDPAAAAKTVKFIRALHHFKGDFGISPEFPSGRPFDLLDWQLHEFVRPLFGWKILERARDANGMETDDRIPCNAQWRQTPDGNLVSLGECKCPRMYRTAYDETPKKQGKTQLAAGIGAYMTFGDGEAAAETYCYAADKENAKLAFDAMSYGMFYENNPFKEKGCRPLAREVRNDRTHCFVRVQAAKANTKHGPNAHCIIFDELHAQPNRELWDTTTTGVAARRQPLVCALTTAGWDRNSICWEMHEYVRQISEGIYDDSRMLGIIYSAPEDADWTSRVVWHAACPSLGITVSEDFIAGECTTAKAMPTAQNAFRQLFLSQWTSQAVRFIPLDKWDLCNAPPLMSLKQLCYGGFDLAATTDLAAFALIFPNDDETWDLIVKYYIPGDNLRQRGLRDRVPYETWVNDGLITATPGPVIQYSYIKADILAARKLYDLRETSYDPWNAVQFVQELDVERLKLTPMTQGYKSLSPPTKEMLRIIVDQRIRHGGNPVLRWNVDSAAATTDASANVKLDKSKSSARIDGLVASIMALDAALRNPTKKRRSIYEREGYNPGETSEEAHGG